MRCVEDVARLSEESRRALIRALQIESINIPRALKYLRENLVISVEDMIDVARIERPGPKRIPPEIQTTTDSEQLPAATDIDPEPTPVTTDTAASSRSAPAEEDIQTLMNLLMECYPSMQPITARSLAASDVLVEALNVVTATRLARESSHAKSDFVILPLLKLFVDSYRQVHAIVKDNPAFTKALAHSKIALEQ